MKEEIGARRHICHIEGITGLSYFIFRLLQSDNNQGKRIAEKMWSDGIRVVVPIWRDDDYGDRTLQSHKCKFLETWCQV